ncbi:flagellar export protein FliJ [Paenibacillus sp. GP183]|uniref:flagellar export protein FliJ n=1 Tax=Paenibacillus sp. GP183 TaxID=1882751 RepID=UPI00089CC22C|nr:flagellar export protein FliJ [Paenibacillus sp. GP183]SEB46704.1 flagellar FliJ protein [Paenibacillus sp. GP183]
MKFKYSFQQIVNLKNNEKTQAEWILSEALDRLRTEESSLYDLSEQKLELSEQLADVSESATTISQMLVYQNYLNHLNQQILKKNAEVQLAQNVVVKKQEHLSEKVIDEKVWTKARERAYSQYKIESGRKEQDVLDEISTNRFKRLS